MVLHLLLRAAVHAAGSAAAEGASRADYGQLVQSTRTFNSGSVYAGTWMIGTGPHGLGRITLKSGAFYEGTPAHYAS